MFDYFFLFFVHIVYYGLVNEQPFSVEYCGVIFGLEFYFLRNWSYV